MEAFTWYLVYFCRVTGVQTVVASELQVHIWVCSCTSTAAAVVVATLDVFRVTKHTFGTRFAGGTGACGYPTGRCSVLWNSRLLQLQFEKRKKMNKYKMPFARYCCTVVAAKEHHTWTERTRSSVKQINPSFSNFRSMTWSIETAMRLIPSPVKEPGVGRWNRSIFNVFGTAPFCRLCPVLSTLQVARLDRPPCLGAVSRAWRVGHPAVAQRLQKKTPPM